MLFRSNPDTSAKNQSTTVITEDMIKWRINFKELTNFLVENKKSISEINDDVLGNISTKDKYFFPETPEAKKIATDFLSAFWKDEINKKTTATCHSTKYYLKLYDYKYYGKEVAETLFPTCISFLIVRIREKKYCLIALSTSLGLCSSEFQDGLVKTVKDLNQVQDIEYNIVSGYVKGFNKLIAMLNSNKNPRRSCAENFLGLFLLKLRHRFGDDVFIEGGVNCSLYPYQKEEIYGFPHADTVDPTVRPIITGAECLDLGEIKVPLMTCCLVCRTNKESIMLALKGVVQYRESENLLSPLTHNLASASSLITLQTKTLQNALISGGATNPYAPPMMTTASNANFSGVNPVLELAIKMPTHQDRKPNAAENFAGVNPVIELALSKPATQDKNLSPIVHRGTETKKKTESIVTITNAQGCEISRTKTVTEETIITSELLDSKLEDLPTKQDEKNNLSQNAETQPVAGIVRKRKMRSKKKNTHSAAPPKVDNEDQLPAKVANPLPQEKTDKKSWCNLRTAAGTMLGVVGLFAVSYSMLASSEVMDKINFTL